jgi:peptidoglycan/xylan/chitin deacetylase (PgdA/CDA1 family)
VPSGRKAVVADQPIASPERGDTASWAPESTAPPDRAVRLDRGAFVVSIDTELAWGEAHRRDGSAGSHDFSAERAVIDGILAVFARHGIAATWALVGHLFLDGCERGPDGRAHPDLDRPDYAWLGGDWFDIDPCTGAAEDPYWYGPDIVAAIAACPVPQEIGSHSFSHVIVDDPACTPAVFASELERSRAVAAAAGVELRSFVYPRNAVAQVERLPEHGFRSYRGGRPTPAFAGMTGRRRQALTLLDKLHPLAGSAVHPAAHPSGVWNVPQTYLFAPATSGRRLPPALWVRRPLARLRQAARHRSLFHLWFHPYNVTVEPERALDALDRICAAAARRRDEGEIDVLTMGDLAARLDAPTP